MSVDTNTKGKNLTRYRTQRLDDELRVLVAPQILGLAHMMRIDVRGGLRKKLSIELSDGDTWADGTACEI
ncbi:MAG: hypothetical protein RIE08_03295 [Acidimicrobiales bacterium]